MNDLDFAWVRGFIREAAGLRLDDDKRYLAEFRLEPLARREGFPSLSAMISKISTGTPNGLHARVLEAMTTNETSFFRDLHPFEALRTQVLPGLIERRAAERRLVIWSAACASGQELYSVAMLLRDHFAAPLYGWNLRLIGTDVSAGMVARARDGVYSQIEVNRGLPASCLVNHFDKEGLNWRVRPQLRDGVEFSTLNLLDEWSYLPTPDVILLRNALYYMAEEVRASILSRIARFLRPGGILVLGAAEMIPAPYDEFERIDLGACSMYRPVARGGTSS